MPPYPLDDKGVQKLLEDGESVIKDGTHETYVNSVVSKFPTEDEWSYSHVDHPAGAVEKVSIWGIYDGHG